MPSGHLAMPGCMLCGPVLSTAGSREGRRRPGAAPKHIMRRTWHRRAPDPTPPPAGSLSRTPTLPHLQVPSDARLHSKEYSLAADLRTPFGNAVAFSKPLPPTATQRYSTPCLLPSTDRPSGGRVPHSLSRDGPPVPGSGIAVASKNGLGCPCPLCVEATR